jgi:hypothetical protein
LGRSKNRDGEQEAVAGNPFDLKELKTYSRPRRIYFAQAVGGWLHGEGLLSPKTGKRKKEKEKERKDSFHFDRCAEKLVCDIGIIGFPQRK